MTLTEAIEETIDGRRSVDSLLEWVEQWAITQRESMAKAAASAKGVMNLNFAASRGYADRVAVPVTGKDANGVEFGADKKMFYDWPESMTREQVVQELVRVLLS